MACRRKGEQPVERKWPPYANGHPVARMIADGEQWFSAWAYQTAMPYSRLAKQSGISCDRLVAIYRGASPTRSEIEVLAQAWKASVEDVIASMPDQSLLVE